MIKQNWFPTLNAALISEGLLETWDISYQGIAYGETFGYYANGEYISIYRESDGRYERPIHYKTTRKE